MKYQADIKKITKLISSTKPEDLAEIMINIALNYDEKLTVKSFESAIKDVTRKLNNHKYLHSKRKYQN